MNNLSAPKRIQYKQQIPKGIYVGRPSAWGNPYKIELYTRDEVIVKFREYAENRLKREPHWLDSLRGKNLTCWCKLSEACHADILLEMANR